MHDLFKLERLIDRELWLITAQAGTDRGGLIATTVSQVSIVPELPRMLVAISIRHHTWGLIERSGAFAMHLLSEDHLDWVIRFGTHSGRDRDKFAGLETTMSQTGSPILARAVGWFDCRVESKMDTGDRTVYLAEVVELRAADPSPILTASRMIELVPEAVRQEMKAQRERDAELDRAAILDWRG